MSRNRWTILFALFAARASVGFQFQTIASTASTLQRELGLGLDQIGILIGAYFVTGLFLAMPAGVIGARFGARATVLAGLALMCFGAVVAAYAPSWPMQLAARVVAGAGGVLVSVLMTKMVTDWFVGADTATAMGIFVNSWPVGLAVALLAVPTLAEVAGLKGVFLVSAALCAFGFALVALVYRDPPGAAQAAAGASAHKWPSGAVLWLVVCAAMVWGWFNAGFAMVFSFGPAMLVERGLSAVTAGSVVSIVQWASMLSVPAGGIIADRTGAPRLVIALASVVGAGLVLAASHSPTAFAFAALGLVIGLPAGPIMALPSLVLKPAERAIGMGVFYTIFYLMMVLGPVVAGAIARAAGSATPAFQAGAAGVLGGVLFFAAFLIGLRRYAGPRA